MNIPRLRARPPAAFFALMAFIVLPHAAHAQQTLYVDDNGTTVYKIAPDGTRTTFVSGIGDAGPIALDTAGNLYVGYASGSGYGGGILRYAPDGTQSNFTGYPIIANVTGLAFDGNGHLFEAEYGVDSNNLSTIHEITQGAVVSKFAQVLGSQRNLVFDAAGNLYVADTAQDSVTKIAPDGTESTFATGLNAPYALALDASDNLYVANSGGITITKVTPARVQTTFATGLSAPAGLAFDQYGNLFVSNGGGTTITEITPSGAQSIFATGFTSPTGLVFSAPTAPVIIGTPNATASVGTAYSYQITAANYPTSYSAVGLPAGLNLNAASGLISGTPTAGGAYTVSLFATNAYGTGSGILTLAVSPGALQQTLYVADDGSSSIIKIAPDGTQSAFATGFQGDVALVFDGANNLFVGVGSGSGYGGYINRIKSDGTVSTFVGYPNIADPNGLIFDGSGNLFESEVEGDATHPATIHKITPDGTVSSFTTLAYSLAGLGFDSQGNLFVADTGEGTVVKIAPDGTQSVFATGLDGPDGLVIDANDNVYVANYANGFGLTISKITPAGVVNTYATGLATPAGLAFDAYGNLYVSNNATHGGGTITEITPAGAKGIIATGLTNPNGLVFAPLPVPVITSAARASVAAGAAFTYQITATNTPTSYNATGLPAGLTFDAASGVISGSVSQLGTYTISLFRGERGGTGSGILTLTVTSATATPTPPPTPTPTPTPIATPTATPTPTPVAAPVITSATSASAQAGVAFSYQIVATNAPTRYSASGLPDGLTVDALSGIIAGTPMVSGTFSLDLSAANAGGTGSGTLSLVIAEATPVITISATVPRTILGSSVPAQFVVTRAGAAGAELDLSKKLVVTYTIKGSAVDGQDYDQLTGSVKIKPGKATARINVTARGRLSGEIPKVVKVILKPGTAYEVGTPDVAKVKIFR